MMNRIIGLCLFSCFLILLMACENDIATINLITSQNKLPVESGKDIEVIYSDSGRAKVKLNSPEMHRYSGKSPYMELPKGVNVLFFDEKQNIKSRLRSNYAIRYENERKMEAKNDVVVVNERGEQLNTEHLIWDQSQEKIYTNAFVKISTGKEVIYGEGLESNEDFTKYKIKKIKGTIDINENE